MFDWWFAYRMKDLVDTGNVADVTAIWEKHIATGEYPQDLMNSFGFGGRAYALPKGVNYWVVFYNKKVFDTYQLQPPQTWDDFMEIAVTLKRNGVTPFGLDVTTCEWCGFIWFEELLVRTNPTIYNKLMDGKIGYNDPEIIEVMLKWKELLDKGYFTEPGHIDDDTSAMSFAGGTFAMYLIGDWWTANVETAGLRAGQDYGIFVMPGITENGSRPLIIEGRPVLISERSPHKEAALKMADYFMSVEGQTVWAKESNSNSPNLKVPEETRPAHLKALAAEVAAGKYVLLPRYWEATPPEIVEEVVVLLDKFVQDPASYGPLMDRAEQFADNYWLAHR
jgi:multiple sugar transport system substrate-binding protein